MTMRKAAGEDAGERPKGGVGSGVLHTPSAFRSYMRNELAREFPAILKGFVEQAKTGNCAHMKLAAELMEAQDDRRKRRSPAVRALIKRMGPG